MPSFSRIELKILMADPFQIGKWVWVTDEWAGSIQAINIIHT
jgi:hypothetical protein